MQTDCTAVVSGQQVISPDGETGRASPEDFFERNCEPKAEVIEGLIREGQLVVLAGDYGIGKSPTLADITICVLNGLPWCGRRIQKRPVIAIDMESSGPTYKRNLTRIASRYGVSLPKVPDELEVYVLNDSVEESSTHFLLEVIAKSLPEKLQFVDECFRRKSDALLDHTSCRKFFSIDTLKSHVLWLYGQLRKILSKYPAGAILMTFNKRKGCT